MSYFISRFFFAFVSEDSKQNKFGNDVELFEKKLKGKIKTEKTFINDSKHFRSSKRFKKKIKLQK